MPRNLGNVVRLRPPFGGVNNNVLRRAIGAMDAADALNVITSHGTIDLRDPVVKWSGIDCADPIQGDGDQNKLDTLLDIRPITSFAVSQLEPVKSYVYARAYGKFGGQYAVLHLVFDDAGEFKAVRFAYSDEFGYWAPAPVMGPNSILILPDHRNRDAAYKLTQDLTFQRLGIVAPPLGPGLAPNPDMGQIPTGTYSYRYTHYNSLTGTESPASPAAVTTTSAGDNDSVTVVMDQSADEQVTHGKVYRMRTDSGGADETWYYVGMAVASGTIFTYTDNTVVPNKEYDNRLNIASGNPPLCFGVAYHKQRAWYIDANYHGRLVHSELAKTELVNPLNSYSAGTHRFIALASLGEYLYVLGYDGLWAVSGDGPESFSLGQIGAGDFFSPHGWIVCAAGMFACGRNAVYQITGNQIAPISTDIAKTWQAIGWQPKFAATMAYDAVHDLIIVNLPGMARQWVYNVPTRKWTRWDLDAYSVGQSSALHGPERPLFAINLPDAPARRICKAVSLASIDQWWDFEGWYNPHGPELSYRWETGDLDLGLSGPKKFYFITAAWDKAGIGTATDPVKLEQKIGQNGTWQEVVGEHAIGRVTAESAAIEDTLSVAVSGTTHTRKSFTAIDIDAEPAGFR